MLVVEIARTTPSVAHSKADIYARAGVPESWIIDLAARTATIMRAPSEVGCADVEVLGEHATLEHAGMTCPLRELLP